MFFIIHHGFGQAISNHCDSDLKKRSGFPAAEWIAFLLSLSPFFDHEKRGRIAAV